MHPMSNILKAEFYKLPRTKSFWFLFILSAALGNLLMSESAYIVDVPALFEKFLYNTPILYFLILIFGGLFIGADFENRTIMWYIASGHKRENVLLAKTIVYLAACVFILFVPVLLEVLAGFVILGAKGVQLPALVMKLFFALLIICTMGMLPCFFAFLLKDTGKTMVIPFVIYFIMVFLLNGSLGGSLAVCLPMGQLRLLALGKLNHLYPVTVFVDLVWIAVCYAGAYVVFRRSDLK